MSGTSLDGVDVVLCEIDKSTCRLLASHEHLFIPAVREEIMYVISQDVTLAKIGELNHRLGLLFAKAINTLIDAESLDIKSVTAIGLHGQTLWHEPNGEFPFSMQLGDASIVAVKTGIDVVCDFRSKDVALGGQGAPFAPAFHQFVFQAIKKNTCILNIGGMANITVLGESFLGYDTGPGNVLMDLWISQHQNISYDKDGAWAQSGTINKVLLERFLKEPYFSQNPPKSTGRECFNEVWLRDRLNNLHVDSKDVQATLLELTALTIVDEVKKFNIELLLVCGGGVKNVFLMQRLSEELQETEVSSTDAYGTNSEFMEAMAFSWLAHKRVNNEMVNLKDATGAGRNAILGGVYASN